MKTIIGWKCMLGKFATYSVLVQKFFLLFLQCFVWHDSRVQPFCQCCFWCDMARNAAKRCQNVLQLFTVCCQEHTSSFCFNFSALVSSCVLQQHILADEDANKSRVAVQLGVHILLHPSVDVGGRWVGAELLPQIVLHPQQREQETQAAIFQDLHHTIFVTVTFCSGRLTKFQSKQTQSASAMLHELQLVQIPHQEACFASQSCCHWRLDWSTPCPAACWVVAGTGGTVGSGRRFPWARPTQQGWQ